MQNIDRQALEHFGRDVLAIMADEGPDACDRLNEIAQAAFTLEGIRANPDANEDTDAWVHGDLARYGIRTELPPTPDVDPEEVGRVDPGRERFCAD